MNKTEQKLVNIIERMLYAFPHNVAKYRPSLQASKNTWVWEFYRGNEDDHITVFLFGNPIVFIYPKQGKIKITNAGYYSKTTKQRLNAIAQVPTLTSKKIYQKNHNWYWEDGKPYKDGTTFFFLHPAYRPDPKKVRYACGKTQREKKQEIEMNFRYA